MWWQLSFDSILIIFDRFLTDHILIVSYLATNKHAS